MLFFFTTMRMATNIHNDAFARVMRFPMSFFDTTASGDILNRFSRDQGEEKGGGAVWGVGVGVCLSVCDCRHQHVLPVLPPSFATGYLDGRLPEVLDQMFSYGYLLLVAWLDIASGGAASCVAVDVVLRASVFLRYRCQHL